MTFVPQPYERFADDLLTALTGGVTREEHRFIGVEETYSLATPGALPNSLKVFGQHSEAFTLFTPGVDYVYNAGDEAVVWKPDGRLPDDQSYFYVNYDLQEAYRRLTDRNPGSVTTTLAEAFARELAVLHKQMEMIYDSAFVDLAEGTSLDHVAALLGLERKDARFASGEALFKRNTPASGDIAIPAGILVSTNQGQNFETTDKRTLRRGQLSVVVPIRALVEGPAGRVDAGAIVNINRPIFGVESVINERETFFAAQKETDEELRRRVKATLERAGKATVDAIKYALIEDVAEITDGNIQVVERDTSPGFVDIKLGLEMSDNPRLVQRIEEAIFNARPAGVRVLHNLPSRTQSESAQRAESGQTGIPRDQVVSDFKKVGGLQDLPALPQAVLDRMPEGVLNLQVEVLLRLSEPNLSAAQKEEIEDGVRSGVVDFIEGLPMGTPLFYNKLLGRIVQPETIADAVLLIGPKLEGPFQGQPGNLATSGRKAKIDIYSIFVGLMEEDICVTVLVQLEVRPLPPPQAKLIPEEMARLQAGVREGGEIYTSLLQIVQGTLAAANSQAALEKNDLAERVRNALQPTPLQLVAGNAVVINARYEETGRLLNNTERIAREEHEVLILDRLTVQIPGGLDV